MKLDDIIKEALLEDMPQGDVTTENLDCENIKGQARVIAKQDLVLSGADAFTRTYFHIDPHVHVLWKVKDGDRVSNREVICEIDGPLSSLLKGERTALNFLGRMSGVATLTAKFVAKVEGTNTKIVDTRKTLPLFRELDKMAVRHGGGRNHRQNLSDQVLLKENHIRAAGGIKAAVQKIKSRQPKVFIEVEVTNFAELNEALECGVNEVLLDNMSLEQTAEAVKLVKGQCLIEASGNMTLDRVESVARLGVDFISVGQLTHSAPVADMSMLFDLHPGKRKP